MTTDKRKAFQPKGPLALDPQAFGMLVDAPAVERPGVDTSIEGLAIVRAHGPLEHHPDWCFESYDRILDLWAEACASPAHTLVLHLDSPGGVVAGAFDCARALRHMADASGKRYVSFAAGQAASAGYALGCTAHEFYASETAMIGSIGVLDTVVDTTGADANAGLRFTMIASGSRKLDGNPHIEFSAEALASKQRTVNALAGAFFSLVADCRGLDALAVAGLQAAQFTGREAIALGLVDGTHGFQTLTALLGDSSMKFGALVEALREAAKGDDANAKAAAKMLSAYEVEDEAPPADDEEDEDEEAPAPTGEAAPGAGAVAAPAAGAAATPGADATNALAALAAENAELKAEKAKRVAKEAKAKAQAEESVERTTLIESRKDLPEAVVSYLATAPIATVRDFCGKVKATANLTSGAAASAQPGVKPTVGKVDGVTSRQSADDVARMDRAMGLAPKANTTERTAHRLTLGSKPKA